MTVFLVPRRAVAASCVLFAACDAAAQFSQDLAPNPGGYIQAAATSADGSAATLPGEDLSLGLMGDAGDILDGEFFTGIGNASASAGLLVGNITANASGVVVNGQVGLNASVDRPNSARAAATVSGGFNDSLTVTPHDAVFLGAQAFLLVDVIVSGTVQAAGFSGSAEGEVMLYKNGVGIANNPLFDPGGLADDPSASSYQIASWQASTSFNGDTDSLTLANEIATFSVPVVVGETFDVGMYARVDAAWRSTSAVPGSSTGDAAFGSTFTWGGVSGAVLADGTPIGVTLGSGSGLDFNGVVPAPGTGALLGLAGIRAARRRR